MDGDKYTLVRDDLSISRLSEVVTKIKIPRKQRRVAKNC